MFRSCIWKREMIDFLIKIIIAFFLSCFLSKDFKRQYKYISLLILVYLDFICMILSHSLAMFILLAFIAFSIKYTKAMVFCVE